MTDDRPWKPTREQIAGAAGRTVPDVVGPDLRVLFGGINPSLYSAAVGRHFARPGNRFWPAIHLAGFTPRRLNAFEDHLLPSYGYGITNVVDRATAAAAELSPEELVEGGRRLAAKLRVHRPAVIAFLGVSAFRAAFGRPRAAIGPQDESIGETAVWVLPNPSGLNAHYRLEDLAELYRRLRIESTSSPPDDRETSARGTS